MKKLSEYLESIGHEIHDVAYADTSGTMRPITKDERLAREVWRRALGYEDEVKNEDGTVIHRVHPPDPRAQTFIFERREGKIVVPTGEEAITILERISALAISRSNKLAEQSTDDSDDSTPEAE